MSAGAWDRMADAWWSFVAPGYDRAVALVGWHRALDALVADLHGGRVLDAGCGPGHLAPRVAACGGSYVGVDRNAAMVARAGPHVSAAGGAVLRADLTRLPFDSCSFDVVLASGVIGLLDPPSRRAALVELARVARGEVRLLEPVHRPGTRSHSMTAHLVALTRGRPLELADLTEAGLQPRLVGRPVLGVYSIVRATPAARS